MHAYSSTFFQDPFFSPEDSSLSVQQRYAERLQEYRLRGGQLIAQKELLEARRQRISQLKGRYNF